MTLHILTLTYNNKEYLNNLHPTLVAATENIPYIWYIRDNNSTDGTEELVGEWDNSSVDYYQHSNNLDNFSKGNNFLFEKAKPNIDFDNDIILLCNNDIIIDDLHSIRHMMDIFRDKSVGIVGSRLLYPRATNNRLIQHAGVIFSQKYGNMPWHFKAKEYDDHQARRNREFQAVTGAFLMIRASCWAKLPHSKMDDRFSWAFEDIDMCLDVHYNQKMKVIYCGKSTITHCESITLSKNKANIIYMTSNRNLFLKKWNKKYKLDHFDYLNDPEYMIYKG